MDDITVKDLALYRLKVAEERLNAAQILFERRMYADTVSRAYYAIFQAAPRSTGIKKA
ncbi:MAG: HEPN domain-containing protein [Bacillota bacterium]